MFILNSMSAYKATNVNPIELRPIVKIQHEVVHPLQNWSLAQVKSCWRRFPLGLLVNRDVSPKKILGTLLLPENFLRQSTRFGRTTRFYREIKLNFACKPVFTFFYDDLGIFSSKNLHIQAAHPATNDLVSVTFCCTVSLPTIPYPYLLVHLHVLAEKWCCTKDVRMHLRC